jgi:hypothetical protein
MWRLQTGCEQEQQLDTMAAQCPMEQFKDLGFSRGGWVRTYTATTNALNNLLSFHAIKIMRSDG